ncbi:molybdopterin-guanine dinucleotide biosynthesis protein B [Cupriavidus basilensis]
MKVFGISGSSGSGKTTLLDQLIPRFVAAGLRVAGVKHTHHGFDPDTLARTPGACARPDAPMLCWWARGHPTLMRHYPESEASPELRPMRSAVLPAGTDLVLVEGHKHSGFPQAGSVPAGPLGSRRYGRRW